MEIAIRTKVPLNKVGLLKNQPSQSAGHSSKSKLLHLTRFAISEPVFR